MITPDGLKKLLCNDPAEMAASQGDPVLCSMFRSARAVFQIINDKNTALVDEFLAAVVNVEGYYMKRREKLDSECRAMMGAATEKLITGLKELG